MWMVDTDKVIRIPCEVDELIDEIHRESGASKKDIFVTAIALVESVRNNADFGVTKKELLRLKSLEALRDDYRDDPDVSSVELAKIEDAIVVVRGRLKALRDNGGQV
jgi:hypothetical protein